MRKLVIGLLLVLALPCFSAVYLKEDTATVVKMGPFVDNSDGVTAETGLTISQADIRLSKNGGDFAQTDEAAVAVHDEFGFYDVNLTATGTNTAGRLTIAITESGALPVVRDFIVVNANVFDSLYAAATTDYLQVDANEISGGSLADIADAVWDEVIDKASHNVAKSAAKRLRQVENVFITHEGQARSDGGGNNTIELAATASDVNDWYKEYWVILVENTGAGQLRHIASYDGGTQIVTFGTNWVTNPDNTTDYIIIGRGDTNVHEIQSDGLAQINAEVDTALEDYNSPTYTEFEARTISSTAADNLELQYQANWNKHTWYVAKSGNDSSGGHSLADAYLTIGQAITDATAGDTIIVGPGTYNENVNVSKSLNLIGTHPILCKVDDVIISANGCYLEYITVDSSVGPDAFTINDVNDITLYRCRGITTGIDGLVFNNGCERIKLIECYFKSGYDGLQLGAAQDVLIERCVLESTGASGSAVRARALSTQADCENIVVKDSILIATTTQGVPVHVANVEDNNISFYNCTFYGTASVRTGEKEVVGLYAKAGSGDKVNVLLVNCVFHITKGSPNYMILADDDATVMAINCKGEFESPPALTTETFSGSCTAQVGGQLKSQFKDSLWAAMGNDLFIGYFLTWDTGNNAGESKYVTDWIQSDTRYEFGGNFTNDIEVGDEYAIVFINHTGYADTANDGVLETSRISAIYGTVHSSVSWISPVTDSSGRTDISLIEGLDATDVLDTAIEDYNSPTHTEFNARTIPSSDYFDPNSDTTLGTGGF